MTDLKIMETKPHAYEVTEGLVDKDISSNIYIETDRAYGKWLIRIVELDREEGASVELTAAEAIAVAEFITTYVRKRW